MIINEQSLQQLRLLFAVFYLKYHVFVSLVREREIGFHCDAALPIRQYGTEILLFLLPDDTGDISYAFELAWDIGKNIPVYVAPWLSPGNQNPSSIEEFAHTMITLMKDISSLWPNIGLVCQS